MIETRELSGLVDEANAVAARPTVKRLVRVWEPVAWGLVSGGVLFWALALGSAERWLRWPSTALAVVGFAGAIWATVQGIRIAHQRTSWLSAAGFVQTLAAGFLALFGGLIVLVNATGGFRRGRQLRKNGRLQLPPLGVGTGWNTLASNAGDDQSLSPPLRAALAAQWRENGRTEHASVAAFARLSLDLMGLGAPAWLLTQAQADGQDEIRHAELCFSLAKALDGRDVDPVAFRAAANAGPRSRFRRLALIELAIDSLVEGALHEGLSAAIVAKLAKLCTTPSIQPMLAEIAEDEGRHAAHAWDVLAFCVEAGGFAVRAALAGAIRGLPATLNSAQPAAAADGAWLRFGIHGNALEAEAYAKARASVVRRAEALIAVEGSIAPRVAA